MEETLHFPGGITRYLYDSSLSLLPELTGARKCAYITDSKLHRIYKDLFGKQDVIVINEGEDSKEWVVAKQIITQLLDLGIDRESVLIGIGGGVITDITGFTASIYMRGISFGFVPTSLLSMVDAAIGGKNGVNTGMYKNMIGTLRQPEFILYDLNFLQTLNEKEWSNGFAEIIKYACIFDKDLFETLQQHDLDYYMQHRDETAVLIRKCIAWKNKTVLEDEQEKGIRKLLNFGHTIGHAMEKIYALPHGQAISLGMLLACRLSVKLAGLHEDVVMQLQKLLQQYKLPVSHKTDPHTIMNILKMDKKKSGDEINYIVLNEIGNAAIRKIPLSIIEESLSGL